MSRLLYRLGVLCVRRRYVVLAIWALAFVSVVACVLAFRRGIVGELAARAKVSL